MVDAVSRLNAPAGDRRVPTSRLVSLSPAIAALAYPYMLELFHGLDPFSVTSGLLARLAGTGALICAILVPLLGLAVAVSLGRIQQQSEFERRASRLAYLSMTAPPLFVLFGVGLGLLGSPVRDVTVWNALWVVALLIGTLASDRVAAVSVAPRSSLRIFHGVTAAILSIFILFHLGNHLTGLLGPDVHARVMAMGRLVYRSGAIEALLVILLGLQLVTGMRLAWAWTATNGTLHRTIQIGSGVNIGAFIIAHLNSALVSARMVRGIPTDWAWASGAPEGLLLDAWNIRLVPHYGLGVFFLLVHLCSGLRVVLLAHGAKLRIADRLWTAGVLVGGLMAALIVAALCGLRF